MPWARTVAAISALIILSGCAPTTIGVDPVAVVTSAGTPVDVTDNQVRPVTLHVVVGEPDRAAALDRYGQPPLRGQYLTAQASVEYVAGSGPYTTGPSVNFQLVTADGAVYDAEAFPSFAARMSTVGLHPGQHASGLLVFDVPVTAAGGASIRFSTWWRGRPAAYWTV